MPFLLDSSLAVIALNLVLAAAMAFVLGWVYRVCGSSLSNRAMFASNFFLIAMTITLIITVVKSSLALSLGLVGALSIVRYRAAIKEPEELAYLFVTIAVGLGIGAGQQMLTVVSFVCIVSFILMHYLINRKRRLRGMNYNLSVVLPKNDASGISLQQLLSHIQPHCSRVQVKRFEENPDTFDASLLIEYKDLQALDTIGSDLRAFNPRATIHFFDAIHD